MAKKEESDLAGCSTGVLVFISLAVFISWLTGSSPSVPSEQKNTKVETEYINGTIKKPWNYIVAVKNEAWRYFKAKLDERLSKEPPESLVSPKFAIAEPIIENAIRLEG